MDHREYGDHAAVQDAEWRSRVREAARADVRAMLRATRRRKAERWLVTATVLIAIVAVLMLLVGVGMFDRERPAAEPGPGPAAPSNLVLDPGAPFAGTPAASWADGAEGITVPAPMQVGEYSAEEVAAATDLVRRALIASRVDRDLLIGHDPSGYLELLAEDAREKLVPLFGTGQEARAQALVSLIAPGNPLLAAEPKVSGSMTVEAGGPNQLIIHTNYLFAYAFEADDPAAVADPMDVIVLVRAEVDYMVLKGPRWSEDSQGLWYGHVGGFGYSIACDWYKKGFLAPAIRDRSATHLPNPGQDRGAYFDPKAALPAESGCPA